MRSFLSPLAAGVLAIGLLAGCQPKKQNKPAGSCTATSDCKSGQECGDAGLCVAAPCDGICTADQVCENDLCVTADGVNCSKDPSICPQGFTCVTATGACERNCTSSSDCPTAGYSVCNINQFVCAQCSVGADCVSSSYGAQGLNVCNENGFCVGCTMDSDCFVAGYPAGMYCDMTTQVCKQGCTGSADCPSGTLSCTNDQCIECLSDSDCATLPDTPVCNTQTSQCVECLSNSDCASSTGQCNTTTNLCVTCVDDSLCPANQHCDPTSNQCVDGCAGGAGTPTCPSDAPICNPAIGTSGTCVACIQDTDCPAANVCVTSPGGAPECVPGCATDDRCAGNPTGATYCDPTKGPNGTCVQCVRDSQCPTNQICDTTGEFCRCGKVGESCTSAADCGYEEVPLQDGGMGFDCNAGGAACINVERCGSTSPSTDTIYKQLNGVCTESPENGNPPERCPPVQDPGCPTGYANEWAGNATAFTQSAEGAASYSQECVPLSEACAGDICD